MNMKSSFYNGSFGGDTTKLDASSILECNICWQTYEPDKGDEYWQIPAGTPFLDLPDHWTCPNCDGDKDAFMVVDKDK